MTTPDNGPAFLRAHLLPIRQPMDRQLVVSYPAGD